MTIPALPNELQRFHTGSRFICSPAVLDTDDDWVILVGDIDVAAQALQASGYNVGGSNVQFGHGTKFLSYKKDTWVPSATEGNPYAGSLETDNAIITQDFQWYHKMRSATALAKRLNVLDKADRIALFAAIIDDVVDAEYLRETNAPAPPPSIPRRDAEQLEVASLSENAGTVAEAGDLWMYSGSNFGTIPTRSMPIYRAPAPPAIAVSNPTTNTIARTMDVARYMQELEDIAAIWNRSDSILNRIADEPLPPRPEGRLVRFRRHIPFLR